MSEEQKPEPILEHGVIDLTEKSALRGSAGVVGMTPSEHFIAPTAHLDGPPPSASAAPTED
ncbi:hypothetical protein [Microbacterium sp.]|uniref:hypothetical protein n=1 Tax=Microbacterium sp. TaxID=51671 RepID=UPI0027343581|nr:hypothetical protein [Microbacterium sp.]MDP3951408.1 hypothetical protein [Microbacterium sp.]